MYVRPTIEYLLYSTHLNIFLDKHILAPHIENKAAAAAGGRYIESPVDLSILHGGNSPFQN